MVEECTDFEVCSASCGGGTQTCSNTCLNGNFGDYGCPEGSKIRAQECNKQDCPGNINFFTTVGGALFCTIFGLRSYK